MQGELVAVHEDSLFVADAEQLWSLHLREISEAEVWYFDPQIGGIAAGTIGGTLATLANGWLLVFTAPLWIVVGSVTAARESHAGRVRLGTPRPPQEPGPWSHRRSVEDWKSVGKWDELRFYARFPQGIPPSVDRSLLRSP